MTETRISLAELLPSWQVALSSEHKSPHTIAQYRDGVTMFLRWCEQTGTAPELSKPTVQSFVADLLDNGAEAATARSPPVSRPPVLRSGWPRRRRSPTPSALLGIKPPKLDTKITDQLVR